MAATALLVVALDQVAKTAVLTALRPGDSLRRVDLVGNWIALEYTENRGVAFGIFSMAGPWLALVPAGVLAGFLGYYFLASAPSWWENLAVGAIVGGAIGNMLDRLRLGYVVDYISVGAWPNFNLADSAITLGVILLLCGWLLPFGGRRHASAINRDPDAHGRRSRPDQQRAGQ